MKILVIDDDVTPRLTWFQEVLGSAGHEVWLAPCSSAALLFLRHLEFDLAFFDHDLGDDTVTGSDIASRILYSPEQYACPKVVWVHSANKNGADNIVSKFRSADVPVYQLDFGSITKNPDSLLQFIASLT